MLPIDSLKWIKGLRAGYRSIDAVQREQYSWLARTRDEYVFTAEIDHVDPENNRFDYVAGRFNKRVPGLSKENGDHGIRIRHAQELLDAVRDARQTHRPCGLMLLKGTKYGTTKGGVRAAIEPAFWTVTEVSGDVAAGFAFSLARSSSA